MEIKEPPEIVEVAAAVVEKMLHAKIPQTLSKTTSVQL
jgi:hypothetical protein